MSLVYPGNQDKNLYLWIICLEFIYQNALDFNNGYPKLVSLIPSWVAQLTTPCNYENFILVSVSLVYSFHTN